MIFKIFATPQSIVLDLLVKLSTSIETPKGSLENFLLIRQPSAKITSTSPVKIYVLFIFYFCNSIMWKNIVGRQRRGWRWSTGDSKARNSSVLHLTRYISENIYDMASSNCISIIDIIKERYIIFQSPHVSWKIMIEEIKNKLFWELSDANDFFIVFYLKPIIK